MTTREPRSGIQWIACGDNIVSEPWDKGKNVELPNPELNPLQNPTLGKNLGRWAQVYFTSPPEKREQAVVDLLRELESESETRPPRLQQNIPAVNPVVPRLICKNCQQPNELDQRFCGLCGTPLRSADAPMQEAPRTIPPPVEVRRQPEPASTAPRETEESDLQWLREKSLSRLSDPEEESSGKWKYILIALVLVAAAFGTLQWVADRPATNRGATTVAAPAPTAQASRAPAPTASTPISAAAPSEPALTKKPRVEPSVATSETIRTARVVGSAPKQDTEPAGPTTAAVQSGAQELNLAQGYLEGKHGVRDPAEAAKWLWKAVAKQNTTADVLLANLYMSGDGVSKSCAQARLLLTAAAQKGEPTAGEKLRQLEFTCR